jgi:AcrR family transcriptional regulator
MSRPARIDRSVILDAATALADESGLDSVTMYATAKRLGVTPMALYRHVGDKAALLDGLVEKLLTEVRLPQEHQDWQGQLEAMARALRRVAHRHPAVFALLLQRPATTPDALRTRDAVLEALTTAGIDPSRVAQTERLLSTVILGFLVSEVSGRFQKHSKKTVNADFERLLELLVILIATEGGR